MTTPASLATIGRPDGLTALIFLLIVAYLGISYLMLTILSHRRNHFMAPILSVLWPIFLPLMGLILIGHDIRRH